MSLGRIIAHDHTPPFNHLILLIILFTPSMISTEASEGELVDVNSPHMAGEQRLARSRMPNNENAPIRAHYGIDGGLRGKPRTVTG